MLRIMINDSPLAAKRLEEFVSTRKDSPPIMQQKRDAII